MAVDPKAWRRDADGYRGVVYVLPDRGWNTAGTTNDNARLRKFGLHNGEPNDRNNLSEKREAMGLLPALDPTHPRDFFLFVANDNDFITQNGFQAGTAYKDDAGVDIDFMFLVYRITVPLSVK